MRRDGTSRSPNLVLVVLDSVRKDRLSCHGYERQTTPNIDRIASEGVLFEQAYSSSCWTIPAHASLFTGLHPSEHRADLDTKRLDPKHVTLASLLSSRGYKTVCITCNGFLSHHTNLNHGFDETVDVGRLRGAVSGFWPRLQRGVHRRWRRLTARDRGARRATALASRWLAAQQKDQPFFLFLNYMDCHLPYRLRRRERFRFVPAGERKRVRRVPQDPFGAMAGRVSLSEQDLHDLGALYDGSLYYIDRHVGELDAGLHRLGLDKDTLVVVTSDHGESFGEHGLLDHQYGLYENLISVPLVMRLPARERAGSRHAAPVQHLDLLPTIAEWLEAENGRGSSPATSGRSIFSASPRESVVSEYLVPNLNAVRRRFPEVDLKRFDSAMRSIRVGSDKLVVHRGGRAELYDLSVDPSEENNLATDRQDLVSSLQTRLQSEVGDWPGEAETSVEDDALRWCATVWKRWDTCRSNGSEC